MLLLFGSLMLSACAVEDAEGEGLYSGTVVLSGDHRVASGETVRGAVVIIDGDLVLEEGSQATGSVYMLGGTLDVNGEIAGSLSIIDGELTLGPAAKIGGNLEIGGGTVERSPEATVAGAVNTGTGLQIPASPGWRNSRGLVDWFIRVVIEALLVAGLAYVIVRFRPRPVSRVSEAATRHPVVSGAMGILVGIVGLSVLVLMAFTIFLIPVAILGVVIFALAVAYGWIAYGVPAGRRLAAWQGWDLPPAQAAFLGTLLFKVVLDVVGIVPYGGGLVAILVTVAGFGAVLLTRFGLRRFVPAYSDEPETTLSR